MLVKDVEVECDSSSAVDFISGSICYDHPLFCLIH